MGLMESRDKMRQLSGRGPKRSMAFYENTYAKEIGEAFRDREMQRQMLVFCYRLYNENRFDSLGRTLGQLWQKCETDEDRRAVLLLRALAMSDTGAVDGAIESYHLLLRYAPKCSTALSNLGRLLMQQGKYQGAEEYLRRAVEADRANPFAHHNLGSLLYRMGQYEQALGPLKAALQLKNNLYQSAATLSLCHMALGSDEESENYFNLAVANGQDAAKLRSSLNNIARGRQDTAGVSAVFRPILESWKRRTAKDSIVVGLSRTEGRSYVGGAPLGQPPLDPAGKPMRQLAAIYCDEFPGVGLPETGLIRIFIAEDDLFGLDLDRPNVQSGFRVLYDEDPSGLIPGPDPGPSDQFPVNVRCRMSIHSRVKQAMPMGDYRFEDRFGAFLEEMGAEYPGEEDQELMDEILSPEFHRIGGYAWFTQSDPREDPRYAKYDTLLFQLDCMDAGDMRVVIGDEGVMNFFIPAEKLAAKDFSDVLYWWDCH